MLLLGCSHRDYAVVSRKDTRSPNGRFVVRVMEDTHFDTTGDYAHVSLGRAQSFSDTERTVFSCGPGEPVIVAWASPTSLVVRYEGNACQPTVALGCGSAPVMRVHLVRAPTSAGGIARV